MSSQQIEAFDLAWSASVGGHWSATVQSGPEYLDANGRQMVVTAAGGADTDPLPFVVRPFDPPLDLQPFTELRVWLKCTLAGDGRHSGPAFLRLMVLDDPDAPTMTWERLVPVSKADTWELHRFWLEDMPEALRSGAGGIRIQGLSPVPVFKLSIACMTVVIPEPIIDVDDAWIGELDDRFQVSVDGVTTNVPALIDLPENPVARTTPYISIVPWSIRPGRIETQQSEIIDNYMINGAHISPLPKVLELDFAIDIFARSRDQKARLLDLVIRHFHYRPFLIAAGERLEIKPFEPSREAAASHVPPGRTPLFYRVKVWAETGNREFRPQAVPFLVMAPLDGVATAEVMAL